MNHTRLYRSLGLGAFPKGHIGYMIFHILIERQRAILVVHLGECSSFRSLSFFSLNRSSSSRSRNLSIIEVSLQAPHP